MKDAVDRFDEYNRKSSENARLAISAIVVLNSSAFLALLTQTSKLMESGAQPYLASSISFWGCGAVLGCLAWVFAFLSAYNNAAKLKRNMDHWLDLLIPLFTLLGFVSVCAAIYFFLQGLVNLVGEIETS
ncbi:hypothetical protein [Thalassorhabdomicrobium marinisediminis]|uniref:hypothetical protein n=1 Tax=Thalassorhabdomicrobium marinisediminis TaxID=2170577 RepID=UPI0011B26072|nr:hypothetical protein [Thalassorhabdomicrobium marinisediminis]